MKKLPTNIPNGTMFLVSSACADKKRNFNGYLVTRSLVRAVYTARLCNKHVVVYRDGKPCELIMIPNYFSTEVYFVHWVKKLRITYGYNLEKKGGE